MNKEELKKLTVKELDKICKEKDLPRYKGKKHLAKDEMIEEIVGAESSEEVLAKVSSEKERYIEKAEVGSIIAFKDKRDFVRSGKVITNEVDKKKIEVHIKSGKVFYITYDDVLWVTTEDNKKWPKDILNLLKESQRRIEQQFESIMTSKGGNDNEQVGENNN